MQVNVYILLLQDFSFIVTVFLHVSKCYMHVMFSVFGDVKVTSMIFDSWLLVVVVTCNGFMIAEIR